MNDYNEFIKNKALTVKPSGIKRNPDDLHPALFPFQRALNLRTLAQGKFCNGANTGLGKTVMQLDACNRTAHAEHRPDRKKRKAAKYRKRENSD